MTTVHREFADRLIRSNGLEGEEAPDNPPAVRIVEYTNAWGKLAYGVVFSTDRDPDRYDRETEYVQQPKTFWERS